jgi:hypothetical protein
MAGSTFDPYAPPQHLGEFPLGDKLGDQLGARIEGGYLVFNKNAALPDICLKCGARDGIVRRTQTFTYTPPWVFALLVFCNIGGLFAMLVTMKKAKLNLPLCAMCNRRWRAARFAVGLSVALLVSPLIVFFAAIDSPNAGPLMLLLLGIGLLSFIVVTATFVRPRMLRARSIDDTTIRLSGVDPNAALAIARPS